MTRVQLSPGVVIEIEKGSVSSTDPLAQELALEVRRAMPDRPWIGNWDQELALEMVRRAGGEIIYDKSIPKNREALKPGEVN